MDSTWSTSKMFTHFPLYIIVEIKIPLNSENKMGLKQRCLECIESSQAHDHGQESGPQVLIIHHNNFGTVLRVTVVLRRTLTEVLA